MVTVATIAMLPTVRVLQRLMGSPLATARFAMAATIKAQHKTNRMPA